MRENAARTALSAPDLSNASVEGELKFCLWCSACRILQSMAVSIAGLCSAIGTMDMLPHNERIVTG